MNKQKSFGKQNENSGSAGGLMRSGKAQRETNSLQFTELDDLFLNEKGRKLRNLKKKMDKHNDLLL